MAWAGLSVPITLRLAQMWTQWWNVDIEIPTLRIMAATPDVLCVLGKVQSHTRCLDIFGFADTTFYIWMGFQYYKTRRWHLQLWLVSLGEQPLLWAEPALSVGHRCLSALVYTQFRWGKHFYLHASAASCCPC